MKTEVKQALISEAQMLLWLVLPVLLSAGLWLAVNPMVRWAWNEVMTNTNEVMANTTNTTIVNTTKVEHSQYQYSAREGIMLWVTVGFAAFVNLCNYLVVELAAGAQFGIWTSVKVNVALLISGTIVTQAVFAIGWRVNLLNLSTVAVSFVVNGVVFGAILARSKGLGLKDLKDAVTLTIPMIVMLFLSALVPTLHIFVALNPEVVGPPAVLMLVTGGFFPVVDYLYFMLSVSLMDVAEGSSDNAEAQEKYALLQEVDFIRGSKILVKASSIILVYMTSQVNSTFMVTMLGNVAGEFGGIIVLILKKRRRFSNKIHAMNAEQEQEEGQEEGQDKQETEHHAKKRDENEVAARLGAWSEFAEKYSICFLAVVSHTLSQYNVLGSLNVVSVPGQVLVGRVVMWVVVESVCNIVRNVVFQLFTRIDPTQVSLKVNLWDAVMMATVALPSVMWFLFGLVVFADFASR
jgi:hypothetical protein